MDNVEKFAVQTLGVEHVILCGRHGRGDVRAALETERRGIVDHWLQPIRDVAGARHGEHRAVADPERRLDRLCEPSVDARVRDPSRTPIIEQAGRADRGLAIHAWVCRPEDGLPRHPGCTLEGRTARSTARPASLGPASAAHDHRTSAAERYVP